MATFEERPAPDGKTLHRVKIRLKGHPSQSATFNRLTDAKRWAQSTEAAIREGRYFKTTAARKHTVAELVDRYIDEIIPTKPRNARNQKAQLLYWKKELGYLQLSQLTAAEIGRCRDQLLASQVRGSRKMAPATVVRYLAAFSTALTLAVKEWDWMDDSPMRKVRKPKEPRGRVRTLSRDELRTLLHTCEKSKNKLLRGIVILAVSTGMRQGEILGLKRSQIEPDKQRLILHDTKNGDRRAVTLAGPALEVARERVEKTGHDDDLLFAGRNPARPVDIKKAWGNALVSAGIRNFRFHDLRHCAASFFLESGASVGQLAEILGHRTLSMVKRYAHLSESHSAKLVTRMNTDLFGDA